MTAFEFLLKDLGWVKMERGEDCPHDFKYYTGRYGWYDKKAWHWHDPDGDCAHDVNTHYRTYEFVSQIEIKDWHKYMSALLDILGVEITSFSDGDIALHNASLPHRIEAHAIVRGWTG